MKERAFVISAFGDRQENVQRLCKNIRQYSDLPIYVVTTKDSDIGIVCSCGSFNHDKNIHVEFVERLWPDHPRSGQRNGDYYQMHSIEILASKYNSILYLDDDMFIVNKNFVQGFELADKFGICLPLNPRIFVGVDSHIGTDVPDSEKRIKIPLATAYNCGTMFVNTRFTKVEIFLETFCDIMLQTPMRGPLAVWKTVEKTGVVPYLLPVQWCVCQEDVECKNSIILHLGHERVRKVFGV